MRNEYDAKLLEKISTLNTENLRITNALADLTKRLSSTEQEAYNVKILLRDTKLATKEYDRSLEMITELIQESYTASSINECMESLITTIKEYYGARDVTAYYRNLGGSYSEGVPLVSHFNTERSTSDAPLTHGKTLISTMYSNHKSTIIRCNYSQLKLLKKGTTLAYMVIGRNEDTPVYGLILEFDRVLNMAQLTNLQGLVDIHATTIHLKRKWLELRMVSNTILQKYAKEVETSRIDVKTGALNVQALKENAEKLYRDKESIIIFIDIDDFKAVNDLYGHQTGDSVLLWVAKAMKRFAEPLGGDVFREGGDEFVIVFTCGDPQLILSALETFQEEVRGKTFMFYKKSSVRTPLDVTSQEVEIRDSEAHLIETPVPHRITVSIGVFHNKHKLDFNEAKKLADETMYTSKDSGKDTITVVSSEGV